jgi:hypothetical protein
MPTTKSFTPVGVGREVAEIALVNGCVWDLHEIAVERHQDRRAHVQLLHVAGHAGNLNQVAHLERPLHTEEDASQKVLGNVPEGDANGETDQTGAADHRQRQLRQTRDSENDIEAEKEDEHADSTRDHISQEVSSNPSGEEMPGLLVLPACRSPPTGRG